MALKRRLVRSQGLTRGERAHLRYGSDLGWPDCSFCWRDYAGEWQTDEAAVRAAWREHRDELLAEASADAFIPWAAREFEGMAGAVSPYEGLLGGRTHD